MAGSISLGSHRPAIETDQALSIDARNEGLLPQMRPSPS